MKQKTINPLIEMWKHMNYIELTKGMNVDHEDAAGQIEDSDYFPIDINFCIVLTENTKFMMRAQNGLIYSVEEMSV